MLVRAIEEHELPDLLALLGAKAEFDGAASSLVADIGSLHGALFSPNPMARASVAISEGAIVGMATYYCTFSSFIAKPCLWLDDLFVQESYRSRGVGAALIRHLCRVANELGCGRMDWVVAEDNFRGKAFYKRLGASIFDSVRLARLDESTIQAIAAQTSSTSPKANPIRETASFRR
jgi:GNAT superfamily N-acetyltransferase